MNRSTISRLIGAVALAVVPSCTQNRPFTVGDRAASPTIDARQSSDADRSVVRATNNQWIVDGEVTAVEAVEATVGPGVPASELTLGELERMALEHNPTLFQARANVDARIGTQVQAGLYPNPRLGYQHNEAGNSGRAGQQGAYVAQEFVRGGKLCLEQRAASHAVQSAEFQHAAQQRRVLTTVRIAFYDVLAAQQTISLAEELVKISEQGIETTEALIKGGQSSRVDLLQARVELNNAQVAAQKARNRQRAAWSRLATVVGMPKLTPGALAGSLETETATLDAEQIFEQILSSSPELAAAQQELQRAEVWLQRARVQSIPNIDVQAGVQYDYSSEDAIANLQVEMPLPIHNRNEGNILKAQAELTAAHREIDRIKLDLRRRFAGTLERYANASAEVERYKLSIVPDAKESLQLLSEAYKAEGRIDFVRLLIAQRTNFQTQIDYLNSLRDWWQAKLETDGLLLTGGLERPDGNRP